MISAAHDARSPAPSTWVSVPDVVLVVLSPSAVLVSAGGGGPAGRAGGEVQQGDHRAAGPQRCVITAHIDRHIGTPTGVRALTRSRVLSHDSLSIEYAWAHSVSCIFWGWVLDAFFGPSLSCHFQPGVSVSRYAPPDDDFTLAKPAIYALECARPVCKEAHCPHACRGCDWA